MEPLAVIAIAVLALAAGTGLGVVIGARRQRASDTVRAGSRTPLAIQAIDSLVADSIGRLSGWLRPDAAARDSRITLASDGTLSLLFSDIAGSTRLNVRLGDDAFAQLLRRHDDEVRTLVAAHDGHVVKTQGDGFFAVFAAPLDAVACALDLREVMADADRTGHALDLRIGVHTGRAVTGQGDVFGESVAFAARVGASAGAGDILVSTEVRTRLEQEVDDLAFTGRLLPSRLKGIPGLHQLHRVARAT